MKTNPNEFSLEMEDSKPTGFINKKQTKELLESIALYYPQFYYDGVVHKAWYNSLKKFEYATIMDNFNEHILNSPYPPKIADLVKNSKEDKSVPNVEETAQLLQSYKQTELASEDVIQQNLAKMREILGIRRNKA